MSIENLNQEEVATASFLENLRSKTSPSHTSLEDLPISKIIVDPKITNEDYILYLNLMHDVVKNLEDNIYPILTPIIDDLDQRIKAPILANDILFAKGKIKPFQAPFNTAEISVPFAMGMMYVVEGSTLGGRFILKNIQESLGFNEENGASYFSGYGNKTGSFWKKFLNILTDFEDETNSADEIIRGADYAFSTIHKHLAENSAR